MNSFLRFFLSISFLSLIQTQKFTEESPYMILSIMDLKVHEWKNDVLNLIEKVLDAELKYADEKKGIACKSIDFEPEPGLPKQKARFLDVSFRGICTDPKGKQHPIEKDIIRKAIIRLKKELSEATGLTVFRIGNVQLYERDRNKLNLIIIPASIGFVIFLGVLTFCLRRMRNLQKHRHIVSELQKKREASAKKALITVANIDPLANDKQRLLQLDPSVVGNVSNTMGSSKEFTKEQSPTRNNAINTGDHRLSNREYQEVPPPIPSKENRPPYHNRDDESSFQAQRSFKSNRERMHVPYESETRFSPTHMQYLYESHQPEMLLLEEQHPRVVVRTVRDDNNYHPTYHQQESSTTFVSIPIQIEHSVPYQRFVPPPYHSDPYYPHANS